jgi:hypothetical protein
MSQRRRSENLSVKFVDGRIADWAFFVGDCFRMQLDIKLDRRMDTTANAEKKLRLGRSLEASEKISRSVWTEGTPPAYSFDRGHIFHEVNESQDDIRRSIVVILARPDPGALVEALSADESDIDATVVLESVAEEDRGGFVDYEILRFKNGVLIADGIGDAVKEKSSRTQTGFAELLRTGL